jgi:Tubulin-tyrosine ligase family
VKKPSTNKIVEEVTQAMQEELDNEQLETPSKKGDETFADGAAKSLTTEATTTKNNKDSKLNTTLDLFQSPTNSKMRAKKGNAGGPGYLTFIVKPDCQS